MVPACLVAIDARDDAYDPAAAGLGRYVRSSSARDFPVISPDGRGPKMLFEQIALPIRLPRERTVRCAGRIVHASELATDVLTGGQGPTTSGGTLAANSSVHRVLNPVPDDPLEFVEDRRGFRTARTTRRGRVV
jgi:hypothetical protein